MLHLPISHYGLLPAEILAKHRVDRGTCGLKAILIQVKSVENSVVKPECRKQAKNKLN